MVHDLWRGRRCARRKTRSLRYFPTWIDAGALRDLERFRLHDLTSVSAKRKKEQLRV